ncbi:vegetative cell wall protein gp1-like [Helianthus annuus]|uniref:vegetative cell wall protein gp1-like n=1 Tax=Helianthus annuus TaxID=4232 RepID=UPI000B9074CB|nr:vegetative cell wall protein gp1-like [Helianthus annuus]
MLVTGGEDIEDEELANFFRCFGCFLNLFTIFSISGSISSDTMVSSLDTGVSDTVDPMAVVSDDEIPSEGDLADGIPAGDLPLAVIPGPVPLAAFPVADVPLDVVSDDDIDLFEEGPPEDDYEGGAPIDADVILPIAEAPVEELPLGSPVPDSLESVASASLHDQGVQHHSPDADPDMAMSATPGPSHEFEFDHEIDDDFDPAFSPDFDPDQDIEFIHMDQPLEAPVAPIDPLFDVPADFDMDLVDPKPVMSPEPVVAPDPAPEHDPVHDDAPAIAPLVDDIPIADLPVVAPPVVDDPFIDAPLPDPVPALVDRAPFASHIDPRYADTRNGWIEDDDAYPPSVLPVTPPVAPVSAPTDIPLFPLHTTDAYRTNLPITFLQDIPPPRPGEGSSRQPPVSVPPVLSSSFPFPSQFPHVVPPAAPSFIPSSEPFLWTTPPVMPLSDPYLPFHVGYTTEDILASLQLQQDALSRRIQELERAPRPPCHGQTPYAAPHTPRPLYPDSDVRFLTSEQQITYVMRVCRALEEDWLHMRRMLFSRFPPLPPSA